MWIHGIPGDVFLDQQRTPKATRAAANALQALNMHVVFFRRERFYDVNRIAAVRAKAFRFSFDGTHIYYLIGYLH